MKEAAQIVPPMSQLDSGDSTQALLKTFAWVDIPEEDTFIPGPNNQATPLQEQQLSSEVSPPAAMIIPGMMQ